MFEVSISNVRFQLMKHKNHHSFYTVNLFNKVLNWFVEHGKIYLNDFYTLKTIFLLTLTYFFEFISSIVTFLKFIF